MSQSSAVLLLCSLAFGGCAFFGKSEPLTNAYYSAEPDPTAREQATSASSGLSLRLGRIEGASYLRERIAYRTSPREVHLYESRRWVERPEMFLRRALARSLFEERGVNQTISGGSATLYVQLLEFDEWRGSPHRVRMRARAIFSQARTAIFEQTFSAEETVEGEGDEFVRVADAFAAALGRVVDDISERVVVELQKPPTPGDGGVPSPPER